MAEFTGFLPASGQTDVARTALVSFTILTDGYGGAQIGSLAATVDGYQVINGGAFVNGYNGSIFPTTGKFVIGIYPKAPDFLRSAAQIDVHLEVLDSYSSLDAYDYSFFTSGFGAVAAPDEDLTVGVPSRICDRSKPFFPPTDLGLRAVVDSGIGTEVELEWKQAFPFDEDNIVYYNVYFSTSRLSIFNSAPDFLVTTNGTTIGGLPPGDQYFFGVRVAEFDPSLIVLDGLRQAGLDMYFYPSATLDGYVNNTATFVPADSISGFPTSGVIHMGSELLKYSSLQEIPPGFTISTRGFAGTLGEAHADNTTIQLYPGKEDGNTVIVQGTPTFQKPNDALTWVRIDGYGNDGYRDGYDGYDAYFNNAAGQTVRFDGYDGYFMYRQEPFDALTTDGTNNDASGEFRRFDYCGTWRTHSPASFLQGQCTGSYYGGVQRNADGVRVRTPDVRTHMLQREELLLESTGEPFVLMRRMWTGARCACMMNRREHTDSRCPLCFVPGTLIRAKRGLVPIEQIKVGEEVLTIDGSYQKVSEVMEREYDGYLQKIKSATTTPYILATPEHPFLTMKSSHNIVISCGPKCNSFIKGGDGTNRMATAKLLQSGNWQARVTDIYGYRKYLGVFDKKETAQAVIKNYYDNTFKPQHILDWNDAKNIQKDDWLVCKWNNNVVDMHEIVISEEFLKTSNLGTKRLGSNRFLVNEEFLWIIGLYIAEGSSGKRSINFTLHKDEVLIQNRVISFFTNHGYNPKLRTSSENGVNIEICSTTLSKWFPYLCGSGCENKKIAEKFMLLPNNKIAAIIKGIYDGDEIKSTLAIGQTSKILALQLIELLHKLGKQPLLRTQQSNFLTPAGNKRKLCYTVSWEKDDFHHTNRKGRWTFKNELLSKVQESETIEYSGKVYNLEVENNHTYVVENIVVHNCFSTGFTQGFTQFFNPRRPDRRILIRVGPAEDDLNIVDRGGLEPMYEPNAWTLPFPAIKDRDVLVRFNPDNTEEFRYEVLNVTRVRAFFTQTGAQKFKLKRMPKTDIVSQFPIMRDTRPIPGAITTSVSGNAGIRAHSHSIIIPTGANFATLKVATLESEGHNHVIYNGVVQPVLGHTHTLI